MTILNDNDIEEKDIHKLRNEFLVEAAKVLQHHLALASGGVTELPLGRIDEGRHKVILEDLMEMIKKTEGRATIQADSVKNITKAMSLGKITAREALDFMHVMKVAAETKAIEKGTANGSINVLLDMSRHVKGKD